MVVVVVAYVAVEVVVRMKEDDNVGRGGKIVYGDDDSEYDGWGE